VKSKYRNFLLYLLAAGFLIWHLVPLMSIGSAMTPKPKTNLELAQDTTCYGGDLDIPTFGDPLHDPIITTLNQKNSIINYRTASLPVKLDPYPKSVDSLPEPSWQTAHYGKNVPIFIINQQNSEQASLRVEIVDYLDGDAKWQTQSIPVQSGDMLTFKNEYRSNQNIVTSAALRQVDGSDKYITLKQLTDSEDWSSQTSTMIIPKGTVSIRFATILDKAGWLETRNYSITRMDAPKLKRGIATFTFDDGWKSIYQQGLPLFNKYNIKTTQFVVAGYDTNSAYMSPDEILDMQKQGHDIGSHSYSHADHSKIHDEDLMREVAGSRTVLNAKFGGINNVAAPFGRYNQDVTRTIRECYQSHRTTDTGFNAAGYDRYQIKVQNVEVNTTPEQIQGWAEFARDNNLWLILVYHQVQDGGEYSVDSKQLESHLKAVKDTGIHTATFEEALLETYPQGR